MICIVPGSKKSSPIYHELKHFLQTECKVVSQIVLKGTMRKGNLRSIVKDIIVQISAKIGDIPWKVSKLPFSKDVSMFIGIDVCHRVGRSKHSVLGFVASINKTATRYFSEAIFQGDREEISGKLSN